MTERRYKAPVKTQAEIIVATLWETGNWYATHELMGVKTPCGFLGSAGHVRARELARNDPRVPAKLHNKVERARGGAIGLDPRYEYFRFKQGQSRAAILAENRKAIEYFDSYRFV